VAGRNVAVGIIPCGSSNDLAGQLDIPTDFQQACRIIRSARLTDIDLISVNGRYFATCGGFGLAADVAQRANAWRGGFGPTGDIARGVNARRVGGDQAGNPAREAIARREVVGSAVDPAQRVSGRRHSRRWISRPARRLGRRIYPLALLRELFDGWRPPTARVLCAGEDRAGAWFSLLISNQPRFGGFTASPGADHRDGQADICYMRAPSRRLRMLWLSLQTYRGRADTCAEVSQRRAHELTILAQKPVSFFGDGEILDRERFFRVRTHPRALWVVSPRGDNIWSRWKQSRDQRKQLVRYYLRRPSCRPMTISA
jgi:diacylglycerol kinase family enzyme